MSIPIIDQEVRGVKTSCQQFQQVIYLDIFFLFLEFLDFLLPPEIFCFSEGIAVLISLYAVKKNNFITLFAFHIFALLFLINRP